MIAAETGLPAEAPLGGVILTNANGCVIAFDPACERMFGYDAAEVIGGDLGDLIAPTHEGGPYPHIALFDHASRDKGFETGREWVGRHKCGKTFPLDAFGCWSGHNNDRFFVCAIRDATEPKLGAHAHAQLIEQLTARNEEWRRLTRAVAHDLRQPIQMISAFCSLLLTGYSQNFDERGQAYLSHSISAITRMSHLLDEFAEFDQTNRDGAGETWFQADESLDMALEALKDRVDESAAEIARDPLPKIFGDPFRFQRLMQHLIDNALMYVAAGEKPRIRISAVEQAEFWRFSVLDKGIGVAPRHHKQIFEPCKRLHPQSHYPGAGLGLTICRRIVDEFSGDIWVSNNIDGGSCFSFTVIRADQRSDHA